MNKLLKTIVLIAYTFVIFLIAIFIIFLTTNTNQFTEYTTTPYNDDITLNVQMLEERTSAEAKKSDYEYSKYDLRLFVRKKINTDYKNIYAYICVESEGGLKYIETTSAKSMGSGVWQTTTMYLLNSTFEFAYNKVTVGDDNSINHENFKPKTVYVKVYYEIEEAVTNEDDKVETAYVGKTLNYMFDVEDVKQQNYGDYQERTLVTEQGENYIKSENDVFKVKLSHQVTEKTDTAPEKDKFIFNKLRVDNTKLPENVTIEKINLVIEGEITNEEMVNSKYFSKYVRLFTYNGALVVGNEINTNRDVSIETAFGIEKLYFTAEILLSNEELLTTTYCVSVDELVKIEN